MPPKRPLVPPSAWSRLVEAAPEQGVQPLKNAKRIDTGLIHADPRQPRKHFAPGAMQELMDSIRERGILQPITVQADGHGAYFVVTGERRWRAATALDLPSVPAIVVDLSEPERRLDRVIENRQRADLTDMEFADALEEIKEDIGARAPNLTSNELDEHVGQRLGISGRTVRSFVAMNHLPPAIKEALGPLRTELRTRGLARLRDDPTRQRGLAQAVVEATLSGRQTVAAAHLLKQDPALSVAAAVAQVLRGDRPAEAPATGAEGPPSDPRQRHYWHIRTLLHQALHAIRTPDPAAEETPLTGAQLREFAQVLEPLVGLHDQVRRQAAAAEKVRARDAVFRLSDALAAWETAQGAET